MSNSRLAATILVAASFFSWAIAAPNVVGVWKGRIKLNLSKFDSRTRNLAMAQQTQIDKGTITLKLMANHRFELRAGGNADARLNKVTKGAWTLKGDKLTLLADEKATHPNPMTIAKDGKSFGVSLDRGVATLTFTR